MIINLRKSKDRVAAEKAAKLQRQFSNIIQTYSAGLYKHAVWLCRDEKLGEQLVEATFKQVQQNIAALSQAKWLKCELFKLLKQQYTRLRATSALPKQRSHKCDKSPRAVALRHALRALPQDYREPLEMQIVGEFSYAEIAAFLNISQPETIDRLSVARQEMMKLVMHDGLGANKPGQLSVSR